MAAYCYLLEKGSGAESPYGIVLFGSTFEGRALNFAAAFETFRAGLLNTRRVINEARTGVSPSPAPPNLCSGCRHGKPIATTRSNVSATKMPLPMLRATGPDGREYHSDCGDRFAWTPPHEKALRKGLQS